MPSKLSPVIELIPARFHTITPGYNLYFYTIEIPTTRGPKRVTRLIELENLDLPLYSPDEETIGINLKMKILGIEDTRHCDCVK